MTKFLNLNTELSSIYSWRQNYRLSYCVGYQHWKGHALLGHPQHFVMQQVTAQEQLVEQKQVLGRIIAVESRD